MAGEAGKGSGRRPSDVSSEEIASNWDKIFGKKNKTVEEIEDEIKLLLESEEPQEYENQWTVSPAPEKQNG
jgi:hypothetical protein